MKQIIRLIDVYRDNLYTATDSVQHPGMFSIENIQFETELPGFMMELPK